MKFSVALFAILLPVLSCQADYKVAIGGAASIVAGYWTLHSLEDFIQDQLKKETPVIRAKTQTSTIKNEMITLGVATAVTVALKTLLFDQFNGVLEGNGDVISGATWLSKTWETGCTVGMAHLAYTLFKASIIPDIYATLKQKIKRAYEHKAA